MQVQTFVADSAPHALEQIRSALGPDAVVLNVRQTAREGLSKLWKKPLIEVIACVPETFSKPQDPITELRSELSQMRREMQSTARRNRVLGPSTTSSVPDPLNGWRITSLLQSTGLELSHAARITEAARQLHGDVPPAEIEKEIEIAQSCLASLWKETKNISASGRHLFIGPAGAGKTTALSKWLAQAVLVENKSASVWRLDSRTANTAESLSVYCDILGVPQHRLQPATPAPSDFVFVDLPGVNWKDESQLRDLAGRAAELGDFTVHLVLNAAYDAALLKQQVAAFSNVRVDHLLFTHLDEEPRWGKLWNFLLGTNYSISFLSAGQNVPGFFQSATASHLLAAQFPRK